MNTDILTLSPVPASTETYTAVPHMDIHNRVMKVLDMYNIDIINTTFRSNKAGTQVIALYDLDMNEGEFNGMLGWRNSYDKTRSVAIVSGCSVWICGNGSVMGEMKFLHKHTGKVDQLLEDAIVEQVFKIKDSIQATKDLKDELTKWTFNKTLAAEIIGTLYLDNVLNTTQLEIVKSELKNPSYEYGYPEDNLWVLFNHITHALKKCHPEHYFENHIKVVDYFKFYLIKSNT